jgi:two-component system chemotaxis response regulator CheB
LRKIRVLVVDDSVVIRRLVTEILESEPCIEVVGAAAHGRIALAKLARVRPDIVILDLEMPEMDGLETLAELRKVSPQLPVIMFSSFTERGAEATLDALALGASDYLAKPQKFGKRSPSLERTREEMLTKIRALCPDISGSAPRDPVSTSVPRRHPHLRACVGESSTSPKRVDVVAIGVSTGGPNALAELLPALPKSLPVPVLVVQHMPAMFTRLLAERLNRHSELEVAEGIDGAVVQPGDAWIAPGDYHMTVLGDSDGVRIGLSQASAEKSCRPAVDVLFRSVAEVYGGAVLSVVLTGMGQDGLRGCEQIVEADGCVIAQDQETSVVWGMPGAVVDAGLADCVLPLDRIASEIVRRVADGRSGSFSGARSAEPRRGLRTQPS